MSDLDICWLVRALYAYPGDPVMAWDHVDTGIADDGIYWAAKHVDGVWYVITRGSVTFMDYERDVCAIALNDPELGMVHAGFMRGMRRVWDELVHLIGTAPWVATGHSLGAARCCLLTGLGVVNGRSPLRSVRFGEPRPGFRPFGDLIAKVPGASYRAIGQSGHDVITDLPAFLPPAYPYIHPLPLTDLQVQASDNDPWGVFRFHHLQLYEAGLRAQYEAAG